MTDGIDPDGGRQWLADVAARLTDHFGTLGLGVLLVRRGGAVLDANDVALAMLGRTASELRTVVDVAALMPPEERAKRVSYRKRAGRGTAQVDTLRSALLRPDGTRLPVDAVTVPLPPSDMTAVVMRDLSPIADRDHVIDWYAALVDRMPVGVVILDAVDVIDPRDIRIWSANRAATVGAGRDLGAAIGETLRTVFPNARRFIEAHRALALRDTGRVQHFPDLLVGDPSAPEAVFQRTVVALPEGGLALLLDDVTQSRLDALRHRQLTERIVRLGDAERREIAMGIHDDPIQQIAAAALMVAQLRRRGCNAPDDWLEQIDAALQKSMSSLRSLVFELAPPELVESGLATAITTAANQLFADSGVHVSVVVAMPQEPTDTIQTTAYRIVAEALTNVRKHASARSVSVTGQVDDGELVIEVSDDGVGIAAQAGPGHVGMRSMHDRIEAVGGTLTVTSSGSGTTVFARLPLDHVPLSEPYVVASFIDHDSITEAIRRERDGLRAAEATAVANAQQARLRLDTLVTLGERLRAEPADRTVRGHAAVRFVAEAVRDGCAIHLPEDDLSVFHALARWHPDPVQLEHLRRVAFADRPGDTSFCAVVYDTLEPILLGRELAAPPATVGAEPVTPGVDAHSAVLVPLRLGSTPIGVLTVVRDLSPDALTKDDVRWISAIGDVITAALMI